MSDGTDNDLLRFRVREIKDAVVAHADAKAIAVLQLLATGWKWIVLQREYCFGDSNLDLRMKAREFLASIAGDFDLPTYDLMPRSFTKCRND